MRIAVLADTHDSFPPALPDLLRGADEIWHLGDVCDPDLLGELDRIGPPLRAVAGNCDSHPWPLTLDLERAGIRCHLVHLPPRQAPRGVHAVLHGHTHVPRDETDPLGVRWLNPGALSRPKNGFPASFAWLMLASEKALQWQLVPV